MGRLLTSVAAAGRHGNEYNNNNNSGGGGVMDEVADGRRLMQPGGGGGKSATGVVSCITGSHDDADRPLNLEVHKRAMDAKLERPDSRCAERDSMSGKHTQSRTRSLVDFDFVIISGEYEVSLDGVRVLHPTFYSHDNTSYKPATSTTSYM